MTIEQCWSMDSWFEQVQISNIRYPKVVTAGVVFNVATTVRDSSTLGCFPFDRYFRVQIKSLTANKFIWESLLFKLCKGESIVIPASLTMGAVDETLVISVCYEKTGAPNTRQDSKEITIEVATPSKPPTDPVDEIPPTDKGTDWTKTMLYVAGILAVAYVVSSFIGGKGKK